MQIEWLEGLEAKVREAAGRLTDLKEENRELAARVEELETELVAARAAAADVDAAEGLGEEAAPLRQRIEELEAQLADQSADTAAAQASWEREREEIRGRVESLTQRLEELLGV